MMNVRFWGTRGSIATPGASTMRYGGNTSCVEVRSNNHILVFDAGTGIRGLGNSLISEFSSQPLTVHLFISHTHWDHIQGFPFFLPAYKRQSTIHIYGPPGRDKSLEKILKIQMDTDYFPVELGDMNKSIEIHEVREPVRLGPLTIDHFYLNHPALCLAYRVSDGKRSVVYATDNEPYYGSLHTPGGKKPTQSDVPVYLDEKFVEFLNGADLYIGEAQYTNNEYNDKKGWGHSPLEATVRFAVQANVGQLALFHHDPMHDDAFIDGMVSEASALVKNYQGATRCIGAKEGMELILE
ncbi:MAG: MBL fold metallo-hydrolase [Ignavibacteriales bacterium]|nr:MBL fold metallo-hydrolase [Ignavibacteriales bacterium]